MLESTALTIAPPDAPAEFNADASWKWRETWPRLDHKRFSYDRDRDILMLYCQAYADFTQAVRQISEFAKTAGGRGEVIARRSRDQSRIVGLDANPYVEMRDKAADRMNALATILGLTPDAPYIPHVNWEKDIAPMIGAEAQSRDIDDIDLPGVGQPGNPGRPKMWTVERVKPALIAARGSASRAAAILKAQYGKGPARETVVRLMQAHPELRVECREAWATAIETLHDLRMDAALAGDSRAQEFILGRMHPAYRQKHELSGPNGQPIQTQSVSTGDQEHRAGDELFIGINLDLLTTDERIELSQLAARADDTGSVIHLSLQEMTRLKQLQAKCQITAQPADTSNTTSSA